MLRSDIIEVLLVSDVNAGPCEHEVMAQYDPVERLQGESGDRRDTDQVILRDLIPSRHPNLADPPLAGASNTNFVFSIMENAIRS